ncbi:unnamed protein product [Symbiodinium natans]|uniref:Uncharacterized protein n=1 Tax=Symbiodinium natans TaxID=878477 RepID=A0A812GBI3_9DINO|nr:unnamed protein product [Symbiodinium natans]
MWMSIQQPRTEEACCDADAHMSELLKKELGSLRETLMREFRQMMMEQMRDIRLLVKDIGSVCPEVVQAAPDICSFTLGEEETWLSDSSTHVGHQFEIDSEYDHVVWSEVEAGSAEAADGGDGDQDELSFEESLSSFEKVDEVKHTRWAGPWTVFQDSNVSAPAEASGPVTSLHGLPVVLLAEIRRFALADDEFNEFGGASRVMSEATVAALILDELCTSCCGVVQPALGHANVGQLCTFTKWFQGADRGSAENQDILQESWQRWHENKSLKALERCERF